MSINLSGTYCIFSAKENEYDCNIIIRSNSFVVDVSYVFTKSWIKEKEICYSICYSLLPRNIKLKCASKCKKKKKKIESTDQQLKKCGEMFLSVCTFANPNTEKIILEIDHVMN